MRLDTFAAHHDGDAVAFVVSDGQGGAHGVAVAAVHAAVFLDGDGVHLLAVVFHLGGTDGSGGAGGHGQRISHSWSAHSWSIMGGLRWMPTRPMSEQCTAPHMLMQQARAMRTGAGRRMSFEVVKDGVHHAFHRAGGVGGGVWQCTQPWVCTMLLMPAPVPPTGNLKEPPSNLRLFRSSRRGLHGGFVFHHELDVVTGGPAQVAAAVLVGDVADLADVGDGHGAGAAHADGVHLVAAFGHVHQHAGLKNFVVQPLAEILFDDRREVFVVLVGGRCR